MSEDDNQVMEAALDAGRAVYQARLRCKLGVSLLDAFTYSLGEQVAAQSQAQFAFLCGS